MACAPDVHVSLRLAHSGDIGDYRDVALNGIANLDDFSSGEAHVSKGGVTATLPVTVVDSATRVVRIDLGTDPADWLPSGPARGEWLGQIEIVFSGGQELTWPSVGSDGAFFSINVVRELG